MIVTNCPVMHSLGRHLQTWYNRSILVWRRRRGGSHCHKGALHLDPQQVLKDTQRSGVNRASHAVVTRRVNSICSQHNDGVAKSPNSSGLRIHPMWTISDFQIWRFLKEHVYENHRQLIGETESDHHPKHLNHPEGKVCVRVIGSFACRLQVCLQPNGCHLELF